MEQFRTQSSSMTSRIQTKVLSTKQEQKQEHLVVVHSVQEGEDHQHVNTNLDERFDCPNDLINSSPSALTHLTSVPEARQAKQLRLAPQSGKLHCSQPASNDFETTGR